MPLPQPQRGLSRRRISRREKQLASGLAERWTTVGGVKVFYRESVQPPNGRVMMHLHGFGLSGRYLLPTAERMAGDFHTLVPDLPVSAAAARPPRSTFPTSRTQRPASSMTVGSSR